MTVVYESGYVLPDGDYPLKHARIIHKGNQIAPSSIAASAETANYPATALNNGSTVDKWRPNVNAVQSPNDFDNNYWSLLNATVAGNVLTDDTSTGTHHIDQDVDFTAGAWMFWAVYESISSPQIVLSVPGQINIRVDHDVSGLPSVTESGAIDDSGVVSLGGEKWLAWFVGTVAAGVDQIRFYLRDGSTSYTGDGTNKVALYEVGAYEYGAATVRFDTLRGVSCDCMAIAAHNLGSSGATVDFQHDSDEDDTWTTIGSVTPSDDSPILFMFAPITSRRWRLTVRNGANPYVGVWRVAEALQMERPFYAGFTPARMSRMTETLGNISGSGELLGRSRKRSILEARYQWANLTYTWVRANLDGPNGLIQSVEVEPFFAAWRPGETQDVDYFMRASVEAPSPTGQRDLHSFSISGEVHAYE